MQETILHIDASARFQGSVTRNLTAKIIAVRLDASVITRDLAETPLPQLTESWVNANFTPAESRTKAQVTALSQSDALIGELEAADTIVIGLPVYNFGIPASLKAWVDMVARAGVTFRYTEDGPRGLLTGKRAIVALASGGTEAGSEIDFATPDIRHVVDFLGITDVTIVAADRMALDADASLRRADEQIGELSEAA